MELIKRVGARRADAERPGRTDEVVLTPVVRDALPEGLDRLVYVPSELGIGMAHRRAAEVALRAHVGPELAQGNRSRHGLTALFLRASENEREGLSALFLRRAVVVPAGLVLRDAELDRLFNRHPA